MSENSKISWCDHTFNGWIGCSPVSPACENCYAEVSTPARVMKIGWGPHDPRYRTSEANWKQPLRWNAKHAEFFAQHGRRQRVFCHSLADFFDNKVPTSWRNDLFQLIRDTPNLDWLVLTKRVGNISRMLPPDWHLGYPNVWLGDTACNQAEADRDLSEFLAIPAAIHFVSIEPMLGAMDISRWLRRNAIRLDWVILGGESGPRTMDLEWPRAVLRQCKEHGVAAYFKQLGGMSDKREDISLFPEDLRVREFPGISKRLSAA